MARAGLPVTGSGAELSDALVQSPEIGGLAFVGGRANGRRAAAALVDSGKRHLLEWEGLNAWGIWDYSDWDALAPHLRKGSDRFISVTWRPGLTTRARPGLRRPPLGAVPRDRVVPPAAAVRCR